MQKKLTKPFITYFEQLNNLIQKKHLNISNLSLSLIHISEPTRP